MSSSGPVVTASSAAPKNFQETHKKKQNIIFDIY